MSANDVDGLVDSLIDFAKVVTYFAREAHSISVFTPWHGIGLRYHGWIHGKLWVEDELPFRREVTIRTRKALGTAQSLDDVGDALLQCAGIIRHAGWDGNSHRTSRPAPWRRFNGFSFHLFPP